MAQAVSPRRSSRARATHPPSNKLNHSSASSSHSSTKADRNALSHQDNDGAAASATPRSSPSVLSEEREPSEPETRQTRQRRRGQEPEPPLPLDGEEDNGDDEDAEEDVTRCICRKTEYPGPPVPLNETGRTRDHTSSNAVSGDQGEEAGGLFIQCDICKVWQHGGCVGIMDEAASPDNYYCEQCRSDLHRIMVGARGQRYSRYLPVTDPGESAPLNRHKSSTKEPESRSSRDPDSKLAAASSGLVNGKRRSTMNSRAAYDEEEIFRKVLEESKGNGTGESVSNGNRKAKRPREDSPESDHDLKRRRTGSKSGSPGETDADGAVDMDSEEDPSNPRSRSSHAAKRSRAAAAQNQQEKELRRREKERESERSEAANRRKDRAGRRRADEPTDEPARPSSSSRTVQASRSGKTESTSKQQSAGASSPAGPSISHKKGARSAARRGKVGRNQYTRERDAMVDGRDSTRPTQSRDGEDWSNGGMDGQGGLLSNGSKPSKPRHMNPNRTSMNELRKRAAGILEYVSRTQVEMAGDKTPPESTTPVAPGGGTSPSLRPGLGRRASVNGASKLSKELRNEDVGDAANPEETEEGKVDEGAFKQLSSLQMMDVLTREIMHWQQQHGRWGDK